MRHFHGGEPHLRPGDDLWPAARLNRHFNFNHPAMAAPARYDPNYFYLTTHYGYARAAAARCIPSGSEVPGLGTVYEIEPLRPVLQDPDYVDAGPDQFLMTTHARVVAVLETDVMMTLREQNRTSWPYLFWGSASEPRYTGDGTLLPSQEMTQAGVTAEYLALLPKWIHIYEINSYGAIVSVNDFTRPASPCELLDTFAHLNLDTDPYHQLVATGTPEAGFDLQCRCGRSVSTILEAMLHQVGEQPLRHILRYNVTEEGLGPLTLEFATRSPSRWTWLPPAIEASNTARLGRA